MRFRRQPVCVPLLMLVLLAPVAGAQEEPEYTDDFDLERCRFSSRGGNTFFSLEPGTRSVLEGEEDGEELRVEITVLCDTKTVRFQTEDGTWLKVRTRVVEEREWVDGELAEVSRNYFALCRQTHDVFYFGEDVDIYEDGEVVSHDGAWLAGEDGALPGLIMPGTFLLGSRYFQEVAPEVALDRAEHVAEGLEIELPAGPFTGCVEVLETTPLEPDSESTKQYCPEVGLVFDDGIELAEREEGHGCGGPRTGEEEPEDPEDPESAVRPARAPRDRSGL